MSVQCHGYKWFEDNAAMIGNVVRRSATSLPRMTAAEWDGMASDFNDACATEANIATDADRVRWVVVSDREYRLCVKNAALNRRQCARQAHNCCVSSSDVMVFSRACHCVNA